VGKLIPNLQKSNHMRIAVKTILGGDYSKFFIKLLNMVKIDAGFLIIWILCTREGLIDKELRHWFVQSINNNDVELTKCIIYTFDPMLHSLINDPQRIPVIAKSFIKTCKRMIEATNSETNLPRWHIWNDMYNMADQLNIRIRPNKLTIFDVTNIHEKLTSIIRRDRSIIRKYQDVIFDEFISPDKDYDGFHFVQLRTAEALKNEGIAMHHCVGGYAYNCAEGISIIFSMRKDDKSYITIEISPKGSHEILQQYTLHDITVTSEKVLNLINRWHSDCVTLHIKDTETYYDRCKKKLKRALEEARDKNLDNLISGTKL